MNFANLPRTTAKHVLVFGPPKSGKTLLVGKLAEHGFKLKWFDLENGRNTLYQLSKEAQERIDMFPIPDTKDFPIAAETIAIVLKGLKTRICCEHGKCNCSICMKNKPGEFSEIELLKLAPDEIFVIDSSTQWSNSIMSHIGRTKDDLWKPEWDHYRQQGSMLDRGLSTIQNAPFNCILITHEMALDMEDGKEKLVPIAGTKNFSRNSAKYFDEVVYCEVKNRRHVAASSTTYAPNVLTGSRTAVDISTDQEASLLRIFQSKAQTISQATEILSNVKKEISP